MIRSTAAGNYRAVAAAIQQMLTLDLYRHRHHSQ